MTVVNVGEAKAHFPRLLDRVSAGEEIVIAKAGEPVARLVPVAGTATARVPGTYAGKIRIADDFEAPLRDDELEGYEGVPR